MYSQYSLSNSSNQSFTINIPGDAKNINLLVNLSYNSMAQYWTISLSDYKAQNPIVVGVPLLCGHDLLGQHQYLGIGSMFVINKNGDAFSASPDSTNLNQYYLIWKL